MNASGPSSSQQQWQADWQLAQAARQGDAAAWQQLVDAALPGVYAMLLQLAQGDQNQAEEWCQEALARAWDKLAGWQGQSRFGTWLYRLARNRAIDLLRSQRSHASLEHCTEPASADADMTLERAEHVARVQQALHQLPPDQQELILMRDYRDLSYEDIAGVLDIPAGTAKSRVFRARQALRALLAPMMAAEQP